MKNTDNYLELALTALAYILPLAVWGGVLAMCWGAFIATLGADSITGLMRGGILIWVLFKLEYVIRPKGSFHIYDELKAWFAKEYIEHPLFEYFKAMVDTYELHKPVKGDSWKNMAWLEFEQRIDLQMDELADREDPEVWVNIGNYAAMGWLRDMMLQELKA